MLKKSIMAKMILLSAILSVLPSMDLLSSPRRESPRPSPAIAIQPSMLYQSILNAFVKKGHPGVSVLVRTREEGTWNGTAGYARLEDQTPVRPEHLFHTLSCAKAYTATAILMLWEEGLIDLDARIDRYLPADLCDDLPNGHAATVHHLLTHTSGIPDFDDNMPYFEVFNDPYAPTWEDALEIVKAMPPLFPPGMGCQYRNTNYTLLALIIDQIAGSHAAFLDTRIFRPLGLANTYYKIQAGLPRPPKMVNIYYDRYGDGCLENLTDEMCAINQNGSIGSAGVIADMTDCARFMEALAGGELIGPEAWAKMTAPAFPGQEWRGSGIGIMDWTDSRGRVHRFYEMAGSGGQGMAQTRTFPLEGVTISCATNVGSTNRPNAHVNFYALLDDLMAAVFNASAALPESPSLDKRAVIR